MRILDQHIIGSNTGTIMSRSSNPTDVFTHSWAMFLMSGQEPKTFSAAAQVFDITDLSYLYNECKGIAFDVNSSLATDTVTDVFALKPSTRTLFKGYNFYDVDKSVVLPDTVSGEDAKTFLSGLLGFSNKTAARLPGTLTLGFSSPINLVGFHASDPAAPIPDIYVEGTKLVLTKVGSTLMLAQPITTQAIEYRIYGASYLPLSQDLPVGSVPDVTYFVLAPTSTGSQSQRGIYWTGTTEFPYVLASVSNTVSEEVQAVTVGKMRTAQTSIYLRSILLRGLEA